MFELLFNGNKSIELFSTVAIIIVIGFIIVAFLKSSNAKFFVSVLLFIVLIFSGIFSGIQLNTYYNSSGGIYGALTGVFKPNDVNTVKSLEYKIENVELTKDDRNLYSASIILDDVVEFDGTKNYGLFVNNMPCDSIEYSTVGDYLIANYTYSFLDDLKDEILTDTLNFRFAFYNNSTKLMISSNGGESAVKYWNYYFNKNVFVVNLRPTDYVSGDDLSFGIGNRSNYPVATFINKDVVIHQIYKKGSVVTPPVIQDSGFKGWFLDSNRIQFYNYIILSDVSFIAYYEQIDDIDFNRTFSNNSPSTISRISSLISSNNYSSSQVLELIGWNIGDEITIPLGSEKITLRILGFNQDNLSDGTGKVGITLGMVDCLSTQWKMNQYHENNTWSYMRLHLEDLFSQLPISWQSVIRSVDKKATKGNGSFEIARYSQKLWLLSIAEMGSEESLKNTSNTDLSDYYSVYVQEGSQYEYFKNLFGDEIIDSKGSNYKFNQLLKSDSYWTRSACVGSSDERLAKQNFWLVNYGGSISHISAKYERGVSFCCCV